MSCPARHRVSPVPGAVSRVPGTGTVQRASCGSPCA